ncbi:MAG: PQQ-binding-like beta-propeller repeat protein [Phycisphaerales bacterium]
MNPGRSVLRACVLLGALVVAAPAMAQPAPVYPDDSVQGREALSRVDELLNAGNLAEASRVLQTLLDSEGDRVLESKTDGDVFFSVREQISRLLLAKSALLERYRAVESPRAEKLLEEGRVDEVERTRLLTPAGLEAALRLAQLRFENAQFEAARLTLEQLEKHPDRTGDAAKAAADLAAGIARFLIRPSVTQWAERWAREAQASVPPARPLSLPKDLNPAVASAQGGGAAPDWQSLPESPLISSVISKRPSRDPDDDEEVQAWEMAGQTNARAWILPVVVDDLVLVNNGAEISALDRFTLSTVWSIRPSQSARGDLRGLTTRQAPPLSRIEDSGWVVVGGRVGAAALGYVTETGRESDRRLIGFDTHTGKTLWSVDPASLDRRLEGCSVRGEPVVSEGVLVVPLRRNSSVRRVSGAVLAGLDLWTGELKWVRPLCSVGVMPFNRAARAAERCIVSDGIVYRVDGLGVAAAIEAVSGRVVWVRRMNPPGDLRAYSALSFQAANQPWAGSEPLVDRDTLVAITPDSSAIVRLSKSDAAILARRGAEDLGDTTSMPSYLVRAGDRMIVVTSDRLVSLGLSDFDRSAPRVSQPLREPPMAGRVVGLNDVVIVPLEDKLLELASADMKQISTRTMGHTGNVIALADGLLVVDAGEIHAFLKWETAESTLSKRLAATPDDPTPALSMVNLAFRAGRYQRLVPAVDRVLEIRDRLPDATASQSARRRLVDTLRVMFAAGKQRWDPSSDQRAAQGPVSAPSVQVLADLAPQFARAAESPAELAEFELMQGWLGEAKGSPSASLDAYGRILSDDSLGGATVAGDFSVPAKASDLATERLLALVKRVGPDSYAAFSAQAARELEELGERATIAELISLARRYPAAPASASAWMRVAETNEKANRRGAAVRAYALALRTLEYGPSAKAADLSREGRSVGTRLVELLASLDRASEAARVAADVERLFPGGPIAVPSPALDRLRTANLRPHFGDRVQSEAQSLVGWVIAEPKITEGPGRPTDRVVLSSPGRKQVGLYVTSLVDGRLEPRWIRSYEQRQPRVVRIDQDATYLYWPAESRADRTGGVIERIRMDGSSAWVTREVAAMLDEVEPRSPEDSNPFMTPLDGSVSPGDLLVAMDGNTLVLIERVGRIVSLDLESGKPLWAQKLPGVHVYDGAITGGTLVIGGAGTERNETRNGGNLRPLPPVLFAVDARKGGTFADLRSIVNKPGDAKAVANADRQQIRWLRSMGSGRVLVGLYDRVTAVDAPGAKADWTYDRPSVSRSLECWVVGDRAFVLNEDHAIVGLNLGDGTSPVGELDSKERLQADTAVSVAQLADGGVAFVSSRGIAVFQRDGKLIGMDGGSLATEQAPQLFAVGADRVAMIPEEDPEKALDLRVFGLPSGKVLSSKPLALGRMPASLRAVEGRLVLTAGGVTIVLPAPMQSESLIP